MSELPEKTRAAALAGLGKMGAPMARRLVSAGYAVHGYDVDERLRVALAADGLTPVASVDELADAAEDIILMLPNSDIVDQVAERIAAAVRSGARCRRIIDMSSSEPGRTRRLAPRLAESGIELVDAPVSGGVGGAVAGTLTLMVGGTAEQYERVRPLLEPLGSSIVHVGPVGAGHAIKALNNLMSACSMLITAEAMTVATRFGMDPATALAVVNSASGRSGSTEAKFPKFVLTGTFDSGFTAALMAKDVGIATLLGKDLAVELPLAEAVQARWRELAAELAPDADHTEIVRPLEARHGVSIRAASHVGD
ncbi:NAD(P)-dependent oxidoreductase [Streptomyces capitiformicae]|uniref:3-hydroxyisobutyrate dehydrogenase n=1 Tax=Streptomyces capitiformicae TaxID=2014920 RepID=A0A918ZEI9_9ACTN|nr:NAD(P)-dependent oxidoreductase [Streptomyces capitiformicae]GHE47000.1 3-hydroxyisobutyrate dehydrogenase [Streptomyces capitiformicae]